MADARLIDREVGGRRLLRRLLRSRPARWAKPVLISILERMNALVRRVGASTHKRLMQVEWGIPPTPEWFDHYQDVYFHWPVTGNSLFLERGVFANLAVEPGARLLDLCCGDGFNSRFFYAHRASKVVAVDFDRGAILHAKRFNTVPNIEFVLADIRDWIPDGTFDNIMWDAAIEHFTESEIFGIMRSIRDRLVPTGVLSGYTVVERPGGKQLVHHEREFRDKADLLSLITPHFEHARVFETEYPSRTNLYFYATNHEPSLPFSLKNPRFLRS